MADKPKLYPAKYVTVAGLTEDGKTILHVDKSHADWFLDKLEQARWS